MKEVEGQEENKMFQGGYTKVKGSGKTDLKRGLLEEAKYTFKWYSYLPTREGQAAILEMHMAPLCSETYCM